MGGGGPAAGEGWVWGSCTGLGDWPQVWPRFSSPSFVTASPKTAFSLHKEQSFDPLLMLRREILVLK